MNLGHEIAGFMSLCSAGLTHFFKLNSLPKDKIINLSRLKAFACDKKKNAALMTIFVFEWVENILGKGENAGYQHFLLFPQCFQKGCSSGSLKVGNVW